MGRKKMIQQPIAKDTETHITITINQDGEVLKEQRESVIAWNKEPNFIKVYYNTVMAFHNISGISIDFICLLSEHISYANGDEQIMLYTNSGMKKKMCEKLDIKINMLNKLFRKCVECGILFNTEDRGTFIVNPFIIAKGEWKNIRQLQCSFEFMPNGKWTMIKESSINNEE